MQEYTLIPYRAAAAVAHGSALVFASHPDDEVYGCGGAIIRHVRQGDSVRVVIITNGGFLPGSGGVDSAQYGALRMQESCRAAGILGCGEPVFLGYADRGLCADEQLIRDLLRIIEDFAPHLIYLPAETEIHPDHRALHAAGLEAARRYSPDVALVFYETGQPLKPNCLHDITDLQPVLEKAMDCFASQAEAQDYKRHITALHAYRTYTLGKDVQFAEAYFIIRSSKLKPGDALWQRTCGLTTREEAHSLPDKNRPLISVIVRTMNRPELSEALQSIATQNYPGLEVIVVDALGHNSLRLGNSCGDFPLRVISRNTPLNRPQAANAGLADVRGAYFGFLDEDDLLLPGHFLHLVQALSSQAAPAAYGIVEQVTETKECESRYAKAFDYMSLVWGNYIPNLALLFDAAVIAKGCAFDTAFEFYEDWDFLLQVARLGDFVFVPEHVGIYRNFRRSGIHHNREIITRYREQMYLKWVPNIPVERLRTLAHTHTATISAGASAAVSRQICSGAHAGTSHAPVVQQRAVDMIAAMLDMPLHSIKKVYRLYRSLSLIKRSGLFDPQYYLEQNPDVRASGMDPAKHYLQFGAREGRNPSRRFDTLLYMYQNPDVVTRGMNPLIHYMHHSGTPDCQNKRS